MVQFNNLEEMQKYFNEETQTYEFLEHGVRMDIEITFDLAVYGDIKAGNIAGWDISARNISALHINAWHITADNIDSGDIRARDIDVLNITSGDIKVDGGIIAWDIEATNIEASYIEARYINFYAVCFAYEHIICKSITGRHAKSRYFAINGDVSILKKMP